MTVNTVDITSGPYTGNGVTVEFAYDFRIENKNQISVFETTDLGVETELTVDTDFTVAGIGDDNGGSVTRVAGALPTNYTWYMRSNYQPTQDTAFESQGGFFPDVHEAAFDKLTFLHLQQQDQINRSLKLSDSYSGSASPELPDPVALRYFRWNATGDALELAAGTIGGDASDIAFTPVGGISSSDVQSAIEELDTEKEPADATILKDADIGNTVQAYDATILKDADIGTTVQAYDADTAKTDVDQSWSGSQRGAVTTGSGLSFDMNVGNNFKRTLTANGTLTFTNITAGQSGFIWLNNLGAHVISAAATTFIAAADLSTISAAGVYILGYESDGTNVAVTVSQALTSAGA